MRGLGRRCEASRRQTLLERQTVPFPTETASPVSGSLSVLVRATLYPAFPPVRRYYQCVSCLGRLLLAKQPRNLAVSRDDGKSQPLFLEEVFPSARPPPSCDFGIMSLTQSPNLSLYFFGNNCQTGLIFIPNFQFDFYQNKSHPKAT